LEMKYKCKSKIKKKVMKTGKLIYFVLDTYLVKKDF